MLLGAAALLITFCFFPSLFNRSKVFFCLLIGGMLVAFPLLAVFTHSKGEIGENEFSFTDIVFSHFNQLHYDAWANLVATLQLTDIQGFRFGGQLVATIFFWFPRSFWESKPDFTGALIGDFLTNHYSMWFNNLSSPITAEAYIDFGILGVIIYSVVLAYVIIRSEILLNSHSYMKLPSAYFIFCLIFILRGSLMSAVAYCVGVSLALFFVFKFSTFINKLRI